jgi:hypothetical protein
MKKVFVWTAILLGVMVYMNISKQTPNDMSIGSGEVAGTSVHEGKTFGMILPAKAKVQLQS